MCKTLKNTGQASWEISTLGLTLSIQKSMITEKIQKILSLRQLKNIAIKNEEEFTRPMKSDLSEIPHLYQRFNEVCNPERKDNKSLFVAIVVYLYCPVSFVDNYIKRKGVRKGIAKVFGLSNCSVSVYFGNAKSLILNHRGFRKEVERVYNLLMGE